MTPPGPSATPALDGLLQSVYLREPVESGCFERARAELTALRATADENYWDLLRQSREAWGDNWSGLSQVEFEAFLSSRVVHKPTTALRAKAADVDAMRAALEDAIRTWTFDDGQRHTHSWHDREDWFERHTVAREIRKQVIR